MSRIPEKRNRFLKNKIPLRIPIKMRNDTRHRNRGNKAAERTVTIQNVCIRYLMKCHKYRSKDCVHGNRYSQSNS